jgi:hypothetical protein
MPQDNKEDLAPLETPEFRAFFAADLPAEPLNFKVDGKDCTIWVKMMDANLIDRYGSMGMKLRQGSDGAQSFEGDLDIEKRNMFLVSNTVVDWNIWRRQQVKGGQGEWELFRPPADERQRVHFITQNFKCDSAVWTWLVNECLKINGLSGASAKN